MIRIMHTALVFLFVAAALLGYGAKEETRALGKEIERLEARKAALETEIALLRAEWDHVTSADFLIETAARLDGSGPLRGAEGNPLAPWRAAQVLRLGPKNSPGPRRETAPAPLLSGDRSAGAAISTASIPDPAAAQRPAGEDAAPEKSAAAGEASPPVKEEAQ